jgi:hypothetical protein
MALDQLSPSDKTSRERAHASAGRSHDGFSDIAGLHDIVFSISASLQDEDLHNLCYYETNVFSGSGKRARLRGRALCEELDPQF